MKGIEKIKRKIMGDASGAARKVRAAAKEEVKRLQDKQRKFRDEHKAQHEEQTRSMVEGLKQQGLAKARLDSKKELLQKREEIIDGLILEVIDNIDHSGKGYERFLKGILDENLAHLGSGVVIRCAKGDESLVSRLASSAKIETDASLAAGLRFEDSTGKRVDESVEALLERRRDAIRQEIARIIG